MILSRQLLYVQVHPSLFQVVWSVTRLVLSVEGVAASSSDDHVASLVDLHCIGDGAARRTEFAFELSSIRACMFAKIELVFSVLENAFERFDFPRRQFSLVGSGGIKWCFFVHPRPTLVRRNVVRQLAFLCFSRSTSVVMALCLVLRRHLP